MWSTFENFYRDQHLGVLIALKKKKNTPTPWGAGSFWVAALFGDVGVVVDVDAVAI
jgi:hypothetical protein